MLERKKYINRYRLLSFALSVCMLLFSITAYSAPFKGAYMQGTQVKDVNPSNQTFSSGSEIKFNAYNNAPILNNNTFNGTTTIDPSFTNITTNGNNFTGTTKVNYNALIDGTFESNADTYSTMALEASSADVAFNNATFNSGVSVNANSVTLGSVVQMDNLLKYTLNMADNVWRLMWLITARYIAPASSTHNVQRTSPNSGQTVTISLITIYKYTYNPTTGNLDSELYDVSISSLFEVEFTSLFEMLKYCISFLRYSGDYDIYSFVVDGEYYDIQSTSSTSDIMLVFLNRFDMLFQLLKYNCDKFFNWYYPLDSTLPEYWRYYNTDTKEQEEIGLAGLMYNISWYLGQMYALQVESGPLTQLNEDVNNTVQSVLDMEEKEEAITSHITSIIDTFEFDSTPFQTALIPLEWCSQLLTRTYNALGNYAIVMNIGFVLSICMQMIGYFRYRS